MFIKENLDGKIMGQTVTGGNKQCTYIPKEDAIFPTIATESVLFKSIIYAEENREIAIIGIPNVFIQTCVKEKKDIEIIKLR